MPLTKDTAITLRRLDYSETSQILAVFTRDNGQQRLIAKGIKRGTKTRVAVGIDLLEMGRVVFSRRPGKEHTLATLTEWRQLDTFPHLRRDLSRCYAAQYAAEVTSHLTETHDPHPALFDALAGLFKSLRDADPLPTLIAFLWTLLKEIGLRPDLSRCVGCGREIKNETTIYFTAHQGGAICRDCEPATIEKHRANPSTLQALLADQWHGQESQWHSQAKRGHNETRHPAQAPLARAEANSAFQLLDYHLQELMSRPAKLSSPLRLALGLPVKGKSHPTQRAERPGGIGGSTPQK